VEPDRLPEASGNVLLNAPANKQQQEESHTFSKDEDELDYHPKVIYFVSQESSISLQSLIHAIIK
jgi:hypothetical protein